MAAKKSSRAKSSRTVSKAKATKKGSVRKARKAPRFGDGTRDFNPGGRHNPGIVW